MKLNMDRYLASNPETTKVEEEVVATTDANTSPNTGTELDKGLQELGKKVEVKISKLSETTVSEYIAKILNKAFEKEDIDAIDVPNEEGVASISDKLKEIRVVSTEDINNDLKGALEYVKGGDLVIHNNRHPTTTEEIIFANRVEDNPNIHNDVVSYIKSNAFKETFDTYKTEQSFVDTPVVEDLQLEVGDTHTHEGKECVVVYRDIYIYLLKTTTRVRKPMSHDYFIINRRG